jgi:hypothetical protein
MWTGQIATKDLVRVVDAAKKAGTPNVSVTMSDPTEDTPPVTVTLYASGASAHARFPDVD